MCSSKRRARCAIRRQQPIRTNMTRCAVACRRVAPWYRALTCVGCACQEQNDRLIQAAVAFCEQHAKTFAAPAGSNGGDGGRGGGKDDMAQGGGGDPAQIEAAFADVGAAIGRARG